MKYATVIILAAGVVGFGFTVWEKPFLDLAIAGSLVVLGLGVVFIGRKKIGPRHRSKNVFSPQASAPGLEDMESILNMARRRVMQQTFEYINSKIFDYRVWHISNGDQLAVHKAYVTLRKWLPHQMEIDFLMTDHEPGRYMSHYDMGHTVNQLITMKEYDPVNTQFPFSKSFDLIICQYPLSKLTDSQRLITVGRMLKVLCTGGLIYVNDSHLIKDPDLIGLTLLPGGFFQKSPNGSALKSSREKAVEQ